MREITIESTPVPPEREEEYVRTLSYWKRVRILNIDKALYRKYSCHRLCIPFLPEDVKLGDTVEKEDRDRYKLLSPSFDHVPVGAEAPEHPIWWQERYRVDRSSIYYHWLDLQYEVYALYYLANGNLTSNGPLLHILWVNGQERKITKA